MEKNGLQSVRRKGMIDGINVFTQNSIRMEKGKVIYFDPFRIDQEWKDADLIFITHNHYDHFSLEDIGRIAKKDTKIILPEKMRKDTKRLNFLEEHIFYVKPGQSYQVDEITFTTVPSYNIIKPFHPKSYGGVGYILEIQKVRYYIAGDTDLIQEIKEVQCEVAFLPIGGIYTMNYKKAAELANLIRPKIVIPVHYGSIIGKKEDGIRFRELLALDIQCELYI